MNSNLKNKKLQNHDGMVWIKNGKVFVKNEVGIGMPPIINPCEGVELYVNGVLCNHLITVCEKDVIELKPLAMNIDFELNVSITEDGLHAYVDYIPPKRIQNIIKDSNPFNKLDIKVSQSILEKKNISNEQFLNRLKDEYNIVYGINEASISVACVSTESSSFCVAEGIAPTDPTDDVIEYFFEDSEESEINLTEDEYGRVDYKNIISITSVVQGQLIAQLHYGCDGTDGIAVDGTPIKAMPAKKINIVPTYSINFDKETGNIFSAKAGRPTKQVKDTAISFHVYDNLIVDSVNIKTGNIKFKGDIEVKENVSESMEVLANQSILIKGSVSFASILAGDCIVIKGSVVSSKIISAFSDMLPKDPVPITTKVIDELNNLISNLNNLSKQEIETNKLESFNSKIIYLVNGKNKNFSSVIYEVLNSLRKDNYDVSEDFILQFMQNARPLMGNPAQITDIGVLNSIVDNLKSLFTPSSNKKIKGNISLKSVLNSEVIALGDVIISGKGCFNSKIYSKGRVSVPGNIRGGEIRSEKSIDVGTAGSDIGVKTLLVVPENGYINIRTACSDTTIKIGDSSHTFLSDTKMVKARLVNDKLSF